MHLKWGMNGHKVVNGVEENHLFFLLLNKDIEGRCQTTRRHIKVDGSFYEYCLKVKSVQANQAQEQGKGSNCIQS